MNVLKIPADHLMHILSFLSTPDLIDLAKNPLNRKNMIRSILMKNQMLFLDNNILHYDFREIDNRKFDTCICEQYTKFNSHDDPVCSFVRRLAKDYHNLLNGNIRHCLDQRIVRFQRSSGEIQFGIIKPHTIMDALDKERKKVNLMIPGQKVDFMIQIMFPDGPRAGEEEVNLQSLPELNRIKFYVPSILPKEYRKILEIKGNFKKHKNEFKPSDRICVFWVLKTCKQKHRDAQQFQHPTHFLDKNGVHRIRFQRNMCYESLRFGTVHPENCKKNHPIYGDLIEKK